MDNYKRYYGLVIFVVTLFVSALLVVNVIKPKFDALTDLRSQYSEKQAVLESQIQKKKVIQEKLAVIKNSVTDVKKKIFAPVESDLGNDTLFFTLYNDVLNIVKKNSVKLESLDYVYNPAADSFVENGKDAYFVCDFNMKLVTNYVNLGKLIQEICQYPYYIKINNLKVEPYVKNKKVLLANLSLRLYSKTEPVSEN